ncbi:MAG: hypothetical protein L6R37_008269 [Teloschistes peruensis]|nr:MAG: hypothetical protein L6R37_008269 [Teloschistes peruensis]
MPTPKPSATQPDGTTSPGPPTGPSVIVFTPEPRQSSTAMKAGTSPTPGLLKPHEGTFGIPSGNSNCAKGFPNKKVFAEIVFATDFGGRDYHTKASYSLLKLETLLDMHTAAPNASEALNTGRDTLQDSLEARMTFEQIGLRYGPSADLRKLSRMAPSAVLQWYKDNKDLVSEALFGYEEPVKDPLRGRLVKFTAPYQHSAFSQATRILLLSTFILQYCELGVL